MGDKNTQPQNIFFWHTGRNYRLGNHSEKPSVLLWRPDTLISKQRLSQAQHLLGKQMRGCRPHPWRVYWTVTHCSGTRASKVTRGTSWIIQTKTSYITFQVLSNTKIQGPIFKIILRISRQMSVKPTAEAKHEGPVQLHRLHTSEVGPDFNPSSCFPESVTIACVQKLPGWFLENGSYTLIFQKSGDLVPRRQLLR